MPSWKKVVVSGSDATLNSLFVSNAVTASRFSGSFTGSLLGTSSWAENALTSSFSRNITGSQYYAAIYSGNNSLFTGSIYDSASFTAVGKASPADPNFTERFLVNAGSTNSYNLIIATGSVNNYLQLNLKNASAGATASSDIVLTADNGSETSFYIDMGINGSQYALDGAIGAQNDAYLYSIAENLLIGNAAEGKNLVFFNGTGSATDVARLFIVPQGTVGVNAQDPDLSNPESLLVEPIGGVGGPNQYSNLIIGKGTINESYLQLNIKNLGSGSLASSDVVATNDIGTETTYFIDMGINSSNYATPSQVGSANDAYLYSTGEILHIGNASANKGITIFAGGLDSDANQKIYIDANNYHQMTGSLNASEGFTGSLYGTASWALNVVGGVGAVITVADEGVSQGTATFLNFIGSGVQAVVASNTASITITGGAATGSVALHTQAVAASTWSFSHDLGNDYPVLDIWDSSGFMVTPGGVKSIDENNLEIYFDIPQTGYASAVVGGVAVSSSFATSASYALTASYVLGATANVFPYTGSAIISGSLIVTGSVFVSNSLFINSSSISLQQNLDVDTGTEVVATVNTGSYTAAFFDYYAKDGTNFRAGTVTSVWNKAGSVQYTDNSTLDIGNTSGVTMSVALNGSLAELRATVTTNNWDIKALIRTI